MDRQRVVITGLGVLAPNGCGKDSFWDACVQGRSGVRAITQFDASALETRIAGEVENFVPLAWGVMPTEQAVVDRATQMALAATRMALEDAGCAALSAEERAWMGVYLGTAMAGAAEGDKLWGELTGYGSHPPHVSLEPQQAMRALLGFAPAAAVAALQGLGGPDMTFSTGCSAGADAIGQAFWLIQEGRARRMLAGGVDAAVIPMGISVFNAIHALSTRNDEPARASRPYDAQRDGFVLAEGAAVLLLEERELALARGAHIYAEVIAFASNSNAYHMTSLPIDGAPLQLLLRQILDEAQLDPSQLGYINAHGSSTRTNDAAETFAYKATFGDLAYQIPINSTKSLIGHTQGAASAIEALVTALALDRQVLPPTINQDDPDPFCDLDYIPNVARYLDSTHPLRFALTHCSGFGGINTALLFARHTAGQLGQEAERSQPEHIAQTMLPQAGPYFLRHMAQVPRRVVITGLGTIAPNGLHTQAFWEHWRAGTPMLDPSDSSHLAGMHAAGRVLDLPLEALLDNNTFAFGADEGTASGSSTRAEWKKLLQRTDRMTHFTLAATQEALRDAALVAAEERSRRVGAVIANTFGGGGYVLKQMESFYQRGPRFVSAYTAIAWLHVANVGQLSIRHRLQGYCKTPVNDLAGGLNALGLAYQAIRRGVADVLITGGSEAPLHPYLLHLFDRTALADKRAEDDVYRPFDRRASGLTIAEGAGICILEEYEHALHRNAHIYGEITGYAQANGFTSTALPFQPSSEIYARVLRDSLAQAGVTADDLACVYLDGRAVPSWDHSETAALREVFGPAFETLACSVPRTQIGHSLAAAGVFDAIGALLALHEGIIPPTMHIAQPDPLLCPPGLVRDRARQQRAGSRAALLCGRSLGGSHAALVLQTTAR